MYRFMMTREERSSCRLDVQKGLGFRAIEASSFRRPTTCFNGWRPKETPASTSLEMHTVKGCGGCGVIRHKSCMRLGSLFTHSNYASLTRRKEEKVLRTYFRPATISTEVPKEPRFQAVFATRRRHERTAFRSSWVGGETNRCVTQELICRLKRGEELRMRALRGPFSLENGGLNSPP